MSNRFFPNYPAYKITSRFGMRTLKGVTRMHNGIDLVAKAGNGGVTDYVTAHTGGIVTACGYDKSAGNLLKIQTAPGVIMVYYHLKTKPTFKKGDTVKTGQIIGYMGATGNVTGAHLHFGIQVNGKWIDPEPYLDLEYTGTGAYKTVKIEVPVLCRGMKCEYVKILQLLLNYHLPDREPLELDGSFGPATEEALEAFQGSHKDKEGNQLEQDKKAGPKTMGALLCL